MNGRGRNWWAGVTVGLLLAAHFLFRPALTSWAFGPDLLTGAVLLGALRLRAGAAAGLGFGAGVLEGSMALSGIGRVALVYAVIGYVTSRWRELFFGDVPLFVFAYLFLGCWVAKLVLSGLADLSLGWRYALLEAPAASVLTAAICGAADRGLAEAEGR